MKKAIVLLLVLLAPLALFAGGGRQQDAAPAAALDLGPAGGVPIVRQKTTYTIGVQLAANWGEPKDGEFWKTFEEETNIHIEWITVRQAEQAERFSVMMASQDYPDAFLYWGGGSTNILRYGVDQKIYIPLNKLIEEHMVHFNRRAVAIQPDIKQILTAPDGNIYSLPLIAWDDSAIPNATFINQTWLDKLGLKAPATTDELTAVLRAFKTRDPNGNGRNDEIPLSVLFDDWGAYQLGHFFGSFGYPLIPDTYTMVDKGKVVFNGNQEGFKTGAQYFSGLYAEGLIDRDIFTQGQEALVAKQNTDPMTLGIFNSWANYSTNHYDDFVPMLPLKGPNGDQNMLYRQENISRDLFMVTNKAKNPEVLIRWVDQFYRDFETAFNCDMGMGPDPNKYWTYDANKNIVLNSPVPAQYERGMQGLPFTPGAFEPDRFAAAMASAPGVMRDKVSYINMYTPYVAKFTSGEWERFPVLAFMTSGEAEEVSVLQKELHDYAKNQLARWISGDGNVNAEWDNYLRELDRIGLERYLRVMQGVYNRYKGN